MLIVYKKLHVPERDDSTDVSLGILLDRVEPRLEKNMSPLFKAILEAALGEAGTVGVMKLDDFLVKLKTAMHELLAAQSSTSVGRVSRLPADLHFAESVAGRERSDSAHRVRESRIGVRVW